MNLLIHVLTLVWITFSTVAVTAHQGRATTFDVAALDSGNPIDILACKPWRRLRVGEMAVASYVIPCGTMLRIYSPRTGKTASAQVLDRGPRRTRGGKLPHDLDLSAALANAIGSNGDEHILWWIED